MNPIDKALLDALVLLVAATAMAAVLLSVVGLIWVLIILARRV